MQGLADGYFVIPYTLGHYLAGRAPVGAGAAESPSARAAQADVEARTGKLLSIRGRRTVQSFHRELGRIMWDKCGMARDRAGLEWAIGRIGELRAEFWENVTVPGSGGELNQSLENAGRVADFLELGELMCRDALHREESCGGHFRVEYQEAGEAKRNDDAFAYVAAWEWKGEGQVQALHKEPLVYENIQLQTRSYK
jgi:succinate dehydrogenase / fumarate reductase flavoprotein subunit